MAVIRNKNSQVKDKLPTATDLQYGELTVNCHAESPAVHFRDTENKIVSLTPAVSANDGDIIIEGGDGITANGENASANQSKDTTRTLSVDEAWLGSWVSANIPNYGVSPGDGDIKFVGGDGITATGPDSTANQTGNTTKTFAVDETWLGTWINNNVDQVWTEDSGKLYPTTLTNNVGIGTDSPVNKLHVRGSSATDSGIALHTTSNNADDGPLISFSRGTSATKEGTIGNIRGGREGSGGYLAFSTRSADASQTNEHLRITNDGAVGIGVDAPTSKLHVNGKVRANDYDLEALPALP